MMMPNALVPVREPEAVRVSDTKCSQCGTAFDARRWGGLELVELLATERVREHVTSWPSEARIEVRRCPCGRALARKTPGAA